MPLGFPNKPPRTYPSINGIMGVRAQVQQASPVAVAGQLALKAGKAVQIGTIPFGSLILPGYAHTVTAFNGTTPAITIGTAAVPAGFGTLTLTQGFVSNITGTLTGRALEDLIVYILMTGGVGNTAGQVDFVLPFYTNQD